MDRRMHSNDVTPRRGFFTHIAASAMAIGFAGLGSVPARAAAGAEDGPCAAGVGQADPLVVRIACVAVDSRRRGFQPALDPAFHRRASMLVDAVPADDVSRRCLERPVLRRRGERSGTAQDDERGDEEKSPTDHDLMLGLRR